MITPSIVSWETGSDFHLFVFDATARSSARFGSRHEPYEAISEVYVGTKKQFAEGQSLDERRVRLLRRIIKCGVINYYKSQRVGWPRQPVTSLFDVSEDELRSPCIPPDQEAANRDQIEAIVARLPELPTRQAEAIRSRFHFEGAPPFADLIKASGKSRQSVDKLFKKGLEQLKRRPV